MKLVISLIALSFIVAATIVGCGGSPAITCQNQTCTQGSGSFQVCANVNGTETYNFGGMSCNCGGTTGTNCQTCTTDVVNYCTGGAGGTGGTGGGGAGGGGGGGGTTTCTATFSGGVSGTYSPCAVTVTYNASSGTTIATAGNAIPGTPYTWSGFSMTLAGMPATGTFDQTASTGAADTVEQAGGQNSPLWEAGYGQGNTFGTASVTITSLGPSSDVNGTTLYQSPHGTWTATMTDQNPMTNMAPIMQTVTF